MKDTGSVKRQPMRRCAGCGEHFPKKELVRVLRKPDGAIVLDTTGKISGRGAYVCRRVDCLKRARKARRIESSLECSIPDEVYVELEKEIAGTPT